MMVKNGTRAGAAILLCWMLGACGSDDATGSAPDGETPAGGDQAPEPGAEPGNEPGNEPDNEPGNEPGPAGSLESHGLGPDGEYPDLRGRCDIDSGFPGDEFCLPAPPPDEGFQIHIGPEDYDDPDEIAKFIMMPGDESSQCWTFRTPNDEPVVYQSFVLSGREGTHHIINTMYTNDIPEGGFTQCADPGTGTNSNIIDNLPGASRAYMPRAKVAPENAHIGREIPPNTTAQADMHYFNYTEEPILREFWMNVYYAEKPEEITETSDQIRGMGGLSWLGAPIAPGTDQVYSYECPIVGDGRILSLLGHYHSHGVQFTASVKRGDSGESEKVFEMFDYLEPAIFEYTSTAKNPDFADAMAGATSGMLEVRDGDVLQWDCHIVNDSEVPLRYTNNVADGEMCNLWGTSVGIEPLNCVIP